MSPALIAALPFLGALLPGLAQRAGRSAAALAAALATALALFGLMSHARRSLPVKPSPPASTGCPRWG